MFHFLLLQLSWPLTFMQICQSFSPLSLLLRLKNSGARVDGITLKFGTNISWFSLSSESSIPLANLLSHCKDQCPSYYELQILCQVLSWHSMPIYLPHNKWNISGESQPSYNIAVSEPVPSFSSFSTFLHLFLSSFFILKISDIQSSVLLSFLLNCHWVASLESELWNGSEYSGPSLGHDIGLHFYGREGNMSGQRDL